MKAVVLIALNLVRVGLFAFLFTRRRLLTHHLKDRRVWLTWLSIGAITLVNLVLVRTRLSYKVASKTISRRMSCRCSTSY